MATEDDDFAAGLDATPVENTQQHLEPTPAVDPMSLIRQEFDGIPEGADLSTFAEHVLSLQERAEKAAEYEKRVADYESQLAQLVPKMSEFEKWQQQQSAQPQPQPTASEEAQRRFETIQIDNHLRPFLQQGFVEPDQSTGYYIPKPEYRTNPQVLQACELKNRQLQKQAEFAEQLTSDFYGTVEEGIAHSKTVRQLQKEFAEYKKQMEERFAPIQQSAQQSALEAFNAQHLDILAQPSAADPNQLEYSPAGNMYNQLIARGIDPREAIEMVRPMAELQQRAAAPPEPAPAPVKQKPARFIDPIKKRMNGSAGKPAERKSPSAQERGYTNFRPTWDDVTSAVQELGDG